MIDEKELEIASESYVKKDFYQIYPEILELATKLSKRWDPQSSNESDPGVVLLKLLAFIADKNNYNIDKNALEAFMPSASQESSMRKLCEMMGYNIGYYKSATTTISFMYQGSWFDEHPDDSFELAAYDTVITNEDGDVAYILTESVTFPGKNITMSGNAIEGTLCEAVAGNSNIIAMSSLDDNNRFYLPEVMIAENGIFIDNASGNTNENGWHKVDNLNVYTDGNYIYTFGFDSRRNLPYIQFPDDISNLMGEGLIIKYIRTTGVNGNVSANTLTKFKGYKTDKEINLDTDDQGNVNMVISNLSASSNGQNRETIDEAYNNFKHTVGTFDTLVTCRDYANKIYQLVNEDDNTTPLVSNIQVSDIRDDINVSCDIVTYDEYKRNIKTVIVDPNANGYDLYLYPFKPIVGSYNKSTFKNSFRYYNDSFEQIKSQIDNYKTVAHEIVLPRDSNDLYCVKNYYTLRAKITTNYKVNTVEQNNILANVYDALYRNFNLRKLDFGEPIPFDSLLACIQEADTRIKNVSLEEPEIDTYFMFKNGKEVSINDSAVHSDIPNGRTQYLNCLAHNILAGRIPLYKYDKEFGYYFGQTAASGYNITYGGAGNEIKSLSTVVSIPVGTGGVVNSTLDKNEVIQFMAPNYRTAITYPAYVNYFLHINDTSKTQIEENENYALKSGDYLCINYTDTSDVVKNIVYTYNHVYTYSKSGVLVSDESKDIVILCPNFTLKDSRAESISKEFGSDNVFNSKGYSIQHTSGDFSGRYGMSSFGIQEQVEIKEHVKTTLVSNTKCYWLVDADLDENGNFIGTIPFDENGEYILKDGEYFFYTNDAKTELVTLGSGTKIITDLDNPQTVFTINYSESSLNEDEIASSGLAAFADINWKIIQIPEGKNVEFQEMQFITLVEGDTLKDITLTNSESVIENDWLEVSEADYILQTEGGLTPLPVLNIGGDSWLVRSRLDLDIGPTKPQTLNSRDTITLNYLDEEADPDHVDLTNVTINANYLIQCVGDEDINIQTANYNMDKGLEIVNDFKVLVYNYVDATIGPRGSGEITTSMPMSDDDTPKEIEFKDESLTANNLVFDVIVPSGKDPKFFIYFDLTSSTNNATLESSVSDTISINGDTAATSVSLPAGLSMITITGSCTLTLNRGSDTLGIVTIGGMSMTQGVDTELLGITDAEASQLVGIIESIETINDGININHYFYYNCPIRNDSRIDTLTMTDPNVWYDYNNVYNKFVVSELRVNPSEDGIVDTPKGNFPYITITAGSKK